MQIMGFRLNELNASVAALDQGAVPYVGYNGKYYALGATDDLGNYLFIPQIAKAFNLPIEVAADAFYYGWLATSLVVGTLGLVLYLRSWTGRAIALAFTALLAANVASHGDVYLAAPCCIIACLPWVFWLAERANRTWVLIGAAVPIGLTIGVANLVRGHAGTGVLITSFILIGFASRLSLIRRGAFIAALFGGVTLISLYQGHLLRQADTFLAQHSTGYSGRTNTAHPMWHSIYIGLGYLKNQHGIEYDDSVAAGVVRNIDPQARYMSNEYERILRLRVQSLFETDPDFIFRTIFAKIGYVSYLFIRYAHLGLLAACFGAVSRREALALLCGAGFSALPGILVMPFSTYLLGFTTFASLIAVICIGRSAEREWHPAGGFQQLRSLFARIPHQVQRWGLPSARLALIAVAVLVTVSQAKKTYRITDSVVTSSLKTAHVRNLKKLASSGKLKVARKLDLASLQWKTTAAGADLQQEPKQLRLKTGGDRYEFQLESKLPVTEDIVCATYDVEVLTGGVALGILDESGLWAETTYCTQPGKYQGTLAAYSKGMRNVRLIVFNYNGTAPATDVSSTCIIKDFTVSIGGEDATTSVAAGTDGHGALMR